MGDPTADALAPDARRMARLVEAARIGLVEFDHDGRAVFVNRHWRDLTGYEGPVPIDGWALLETIHPDDREQQVAMWTATAGEGRRYATTVRMYGPDGELRYLDVLADPVRDETGAPGGFVASLTDVTDRTRGEEAARRSEQRHRAVVESLDEGLVILDATGAVISANPSAARIGGVDFRDLIGPEHIGVTWDWFDEAGTPLAVADLPPARTLAEGTAVSGAVIGFRRGPDDDPVWLRMQSRTMPGGDDVILTFRDVTEEKRADDALRQSEQRYRSFLEHAPIGQVVTDLDATIIECNQKFADMIGRSSDDVRGKSPVDLIHPDDLEVAVTILAELDGPEADPSGDLADTEVRLMRPDGSIIWVTGNAVVMHDVHGEPEYLHVALTDVTERRDAAEELRRLASIVESTTDIVGVIDFDSGRLLYLNRAARELLGYIDADVTRVHSRRLYATDVIRLFRGEVEAAIRSGENWTGELDMRRADGGSIRVWQTISGDVDANGRITTLSSVGRDITERSEREVHLAHRATHDPLTDLPNRSLLLDHLELALARAQRKGNLVALLFIDLDRFKTVNDNLGHDAGDELLRTVSERIRNVVRPADTLSRLGGDEFVILCEDVEDEGHAVAITQRVTAAIESRPFVAAGTQLEVTASVGIALSGDETTHPEALLRDADAAMYRAKDLGRNRHEVFDERMRRLSAHRLELADDLARAIEQSEIAVHFQPIVDLRTGAVTGVEGLARWQHPTRGLLPPYEFIGLAEETGLIVGLGLAVLSRSCDQARRWEIELGVRAPQVHVNLSARQLTHASLPSVVEGVLDQSLIEPDRLCLEITESVLMEDAPKAIETLGELKELGVELAIDDFGTGYSSLSYLRRFPVDVLKVDRSFVDGLGPDPHDSSIVAAIVNLAHTLDLTCVAEGVETAEQLAALRRLGCEAAQGFLFARPEPVPAVNRQILTTFDVGDR